jgi:hypothetical protein
LTPSKHVWIAEEVFEGVGVVVSVELGVAVAALEVVPVEVVSAELPAEELEELPHPASSAATASATSAHAKYRRITGAILLPGLVPCAPLEGRSFLGFFLRKLLAR